MSAGIVRFLANPRAFVLLELGEEGASASLAVAWQRTFGCDPDFGEAGDAVAGIHFPVDTNDHADVRGMCVSRAAKGDGVGLAIRLLIAKYALDRVETMNRPPFGTGSTADDGTAPGEAEGFSWPEAFSWTHDLERHRYNADAVEIWPQESSRPVRDRIVIEHADQPGMFVHRARRSPKVYWCLPATNLAEALTFASVENAQEWIEKRGSTEKNPLVLRYRAVAQALLDQEDARADAQIIEDMTG
ncbi:MAG: hypothetical protein WCJ67_12065 [Thermoleophilia bacterium]